MHSLVGESCAASSSSSWLISSVGQDKCFPCPAGFHCPKGLRRRCPPGFYCPQRTGISFNPCPPGTFNPSYGLSQAERCQKCPAGEEMTECSGCPQGAASEADLCISLLLIHWDIFPTWKGKHNNTWSRFLVPLVLSPSKPNLVAFYPLWGRRTVCFYTRGFPEECDLNWNAAVEWSALWKPPTLSSSQYTQHTSSPVLYWCSFFPFVVFQECSVETGDSPLQVVPAGQGSSAQQVSNVMLRRANEKWKSRKL